MLPPWPAQPALGSSPGRSLALPGRAGLCPARASASRQGQLLSKALGTGLRTEGSRATGGGCLPWTRAVWPPPPLQPSSQAPPFASYTPPVTGPGRPGTRQARLRPREAPAAPASPGRGLPEKGRIHASASGRTAFALPACSLAPGARRARPCPPNENPVAWPGSCLPAGGAVPQALPAGGARCHAAEACYGREAPRSQTAATCTRGCRAPAPPPHRAGEPRQARRVSGVPGSLRREAAQGRSH